MIKYEMLPFDEWNDLKPLHEKLFPEVAFPSNEVSCAAIARDEDKIVAFWFLQMCAHAEPVGIDPDYSGQVNLHALQSTLHKAFIAAAGLEYYVTTPDDRWDEVLQKNGFSLVGLLYRSNIPRESEV